jgi:cysteine sulfinate desulfinase/cysteine desulfurase-like protein
VIYLDHAAATPLSEAAWSAMVPYLREHFGNPAEPTRPDAPPGRA